MTCIQTDHSYHIEQALGLVAKKYLCFEFDPGKDAVLVVAIPEWIIWVGCKIVSERKCMLYQACRLHQEDFHHRTSEVCTMHSPVVFKCAH